MSRPRFLRSVVFLSAFVAPIVVSSAQRQNTSEPLASPSPLSSRRAAPTKIGQGVPIPGARFDPRQRLHRRGTSTPQTTSLSHPFTAVAVADVNGDPILRQSVSSQDALTGAGHCGATNTGGIAGRCGYGPRLPLLVISPFAKANFVDNTLTDQTSILRFIEDTFALGRIGAKSSDQFAGTFNNMLNLAKPRTDILILDSSTGEPAQ